MSNRRPRYWKRIPANNLPSCTNVKEKAEMARIYDKKADKF
jgi:hypothetical protein